MSNEKPTMTETLFAYAINLVKIDAATNLIAGLVECDKIEKDHVEDILANLKSIRRNIDEAFDVEAEEKEPENIHVNEDQESDAQSQPPHGFKG